MKAVLVAAGFGTRLRPLTDRIPKCLVPIRDQPLLDIWLQQLDRDGIGPVLVNTHYLPDAVEKFVESSAHAASVTLVHEPELLGTAGTLRANRSFFGRDAVLFAHADNLCRCDLAAFVRAHRQRPAGVLITMMTFVTDAPETCGIVDLDANGLVIGFHEKVRNPPGNLANGAVYIVEPEVVDFIEQLPDGPQDFSTQVLPHFVGRMHAWQNTGVHRDIGTPDSLAAARRE